METHTGKVTAVTYTGLVTMDTHTGKNTVVFQMNACCGNT